MYPIYKPLTEASGKHVRKGPPLVAYREDHGPGWGDFVQWFNAQPRRDRRGLDPCKLGTRMAYAWLTRLIFQINPRPAPLDTMPTQEAAQEASSLYQIAVAIALEVLWVRGGRKTLFLEGDDLASCLLASTCSVDVADVTLPASLRSVVCLSESSPDAVAILAAFIPSETLRDTLAELEAFPNCDIGMAARVPESQALFVAATSRGSLKSEDSAPHWTAFCSELEGLREYYQGADLAEDVTVDGEVGIDDGKVFFRAASLFLRLPLYLAAAPGSIRDGLPETFVQGGPPPMKATTIFARVSHGERSIHLRGGHFRSYGHERYKHNTDGSPKIGWVKPALIGGKIDPKTVEQSIA